MSLRCLLCLLAGVWAVGCGKPEDTTKASAAKAPMETQAAAAPATVPEPPAPAVPPPAAAAPVPELTLTPELEGAVVLVRVSVAATLLREHAGVLLHPEAVVPPVAADSPRRFIAVHLPAYDEAALRDPSCLIQVLREKFDPNGNPYVMQFKGVLAQFNAAAHVAILQITEDFPYRLEAGLSAGANAGAGGLWLLQPAFNPQVLTVAEPLKPKQLRDGTRPPVLGTAVQGKLDVALLPASLKDGVLTVADAPGAAAVRVHPSVVLSGEGLLAGFASRRPGQQEWEFQAFSAKPAVEEQRMRYIPKSVEIGSMGGYYRQEGHFTVTLKGELLDPLKEYSMCRAVVQNMPTADFTPAANPREDQPPITQEGDYIPCNMSPEGKVLIDMHLPQGMTSTNQLVQLQLTKVGASGVQVVFHAAPFMVSTVKRGAGVYQSVLGVAGPSDALPAVPPAPPAPPAITDTAPPSMPPTTPPATTTPPPAEGKPAAPAVAGRRELTTESPILYGVPICEGREVLFKLEGAPYWKRLSLAEGKWLPLPAEDLGTACVAGNKEALFVLHPELGEVRRYHATTLALEKTARLPDGISYQGLAAGCLTDDGPVTVLHEDGALACDPKKMSLELLPTLTKKDTGRTPPKFYYLASGDGTVVWSRLLQKSFAATPFAYRYVDEVSGYTRSAVSGTSGSKDGALPTVAASCVWGDGIRYPGALTPSHAVLLQRLPGTAAGPLANSPNFFMLHQRSYAKDGTTPRSAQCAFYSYYSAEPWATVEVPESADVPNTDWESLAVRLWLDPGTLTFALWHHAQTITLHTLEKSTLPPQATPVLLNYPDCFVPRGSGFHFTPLLLGGAAQVSASETPAGFTVGAGGIMDWQPRTEAPQQQMTFGVKLADSAAAKGQPQAAQQAVEFKIQLQLSGEQPVVALPGSLTGQTAEDALTGAVRLNPWVSLVPLASRRYTSDRPIQSVQPGLDDYVALNLQDKTLALFSVKDWKVAGSLHLGDDAAAYMGGDVVFVFSKITRELTRHSLPDFAVTHRYKLPATVQLRGLCVGTQPAGPVMLMQEQELPVKNKQKYGPATMRENSVLILDKQTLAPGKWAPCKGRNDTLTTYPSFFNFNSDNGTPMQYPASSDGRLAVLPSGLLAISPVLTVYLPYRHSTMFYHPRPQLRTTASPTGDQVFVDGQMYRSDLPPLKICEAQQQPALSLCGNYIAWLKTDDKGHKQVRLNSAYDGRPLMTLAGVDVLRISDGETDSKRRQIMPLGEKNLLIVLSRGGNAMQVINLDLAAAYQGTTPESAYVTSHPFPIVAEGRVLDYQVTVSQPAAVDRYELRDPVPGASLTPDGHLTYRAPSVLTESKQVNIAILIRFKNGESALHPFPITAIAVKQTAAAQAEAEREAKAKVGR